jgi:hypothetical protein
MRAQEDLTPDAFRTADPAPALAAPFVRVTSRKQLESLALEFQNCLADHAVRIADGRMAVYAWRIDPAAAIALNWDAAGWRLSEAKAPHNVDLEDGQLRELVRRLEGAGVRTGPSIQSLSSRLDDWANGTTTATRSATRSSSSSPSATCGADSCSPAKTCSAAAQCLLRSMFFRSK